MEDCIFLRYQYRIYPNSIQQEQCQINADCARFVHNYYLGMQTIAWQTQHRSMGYFDCANDLKYLKLVFPWLKDADAMVLQEELKDLQRSYENFFNGNAEYPKFRSKRESGFSWRTRNQASKKGVYSVRLSEDKKYLHLPKLDWVRIRISRELPGTIENATVIKKSSGKYFVSLTLKIAISKRLGNNNGQEHGLDLGLKSFYILDNGIEAESLKILRRYESKIKKTQRRLSRMKKGSANYLKQKNRLARLHEKVANIRHDFLHKESTKLAQMCSLLCIEDLNTAGMMKNHHLAKSIADASWSEFVRMLEYKMPLHGGTLVKVPRFYASSQTCHICGHRDPKTKDLAVREWTCPVCKTAHDRDVNAAINILSKGKAMLQAA